MKAEGRTSRRGGNEAESLAVSTIAQACCAQESSGVLVKMLILVQEVWAGPEMLHF